jgi:hypothetical protein
MNLEDAWELQRAQQRILELEKEVFDLKRLRDEQWATNNRDLERRREAERRLSAVMKAL